jgi:cell wall-associated NlpC family hydrolase
MRVGLVAAVVVLAAAAPAAAAPREAVVDVPVATVWTSPAAPRSVDRPALGGRPDVRAWSAALDTTARRGLVGRIETQALLGDRVLVLRRRGGWAKVVVPGQPTPRDRRGYPGWVPAAQLTAAPEEAPDGRVATVKTPTAALDLPGRDLEVSRGTALPIVGEEGDDVLVATPSGGTGRIDRRAVWTAGAAPATGRRIVRDARRFLGVRYLWGGTSAFGFDCSGLVQLLYRTRGVTVPRDADAQAAAGRPVARGELEPGDVLFYGVSRVHHSALYVGGGRMLEAPDSSSRVRIVPVRRADYAGARRFAS